MLDVDSFAVAFADFFFRIAEVFFKFVTWLLVLVALQAGYEVTKSASLFWLSSLANTVYGIALGTQMLAVAARNPATYSVPGKWQGLASVVAIIVATCVFMLCATPLFGGGLDAVIRTLIALKR